MRSQKTINDLQDEANRKNLEDIIKNQKSNDGLKLFLSAVFVLGVLALAEYLL